jgi:hypothetical protein
LKDILGKTQTGFSRLQRSVNTAAEKNIPPAKPSDIVKELLATKKPLVIADPLKAVSTPDVPPKDVTSSGTINKPIIGSIQRPESS